MDVKQKSKEINMKNVNKEDIPRQWKQHDPHTDMANTQQHRNKWPQKNIWKIIQDKNVKWNIPQRIYLKYVCRNTNKIKNIEHEKLSYRRYTKSADRRYKKSPDRTGPYTDMISTQ